MGHPLAGRWDTEMTMRAHKVGTSQAARGITGQQVIRICVVIAGSPGTRAGGMISEGFLEEFSKLRPTG